MNIAIALLVYSFNVHAFTEKCVENSYVLNEGRLQFCLPTTSVVGPELVPVGNQRLTEMLDKYQGDSNFRKIMSDATGVGYEALQKLASTQTGRIDITTDDVTPDWKVKAVAKYLNDKAGLTAQVEALPEKNRKKEAEDEAAEEKSRAKEAKILGPPRSIGDLGALIDSNLSVIRAYAKGGCDEAKNLDRATPMRVIKVNFADGGEEKWLPVGLKQVGEKYEIQYYHPGRPDLETRMIDAPPGHMPVLIGKDGKKNFPFQPFVIPMRASKVDVLYDGFFAPGQMPDTFCDMAKSAAPFVRSAQPGAKPSSEPSDVSL